MNTENTENTSAEATPPNEPSTEAPSSDASSAQAEAHDATPAPAPAPKAPSDDADDDPPPPQKAATAKAEADEEPGDDIGNRLPRGGLPDDIGNKKPGQSGGGSGGGGGEGHAKKKRRRRKKKGAEGAAKHDGEHAAEGGEAAEGEAAEGEAAEGEEHEGGEHEGGERRGKGGKDPSRDRPAFSIGEEVFGKVERLTEHAVWVDISGKAMGLFARGELDEGSDPPVEGDQFIATVASTGVRGGMLMLSRLPLILEETRKALEGAAQSGEAVLGFVTGAVKGGLEVDLGGLRAFAPASHVDLRHGADLSHLVGQRLDFIVTQYAKKGRDIVVSRRKMLEEEAKKARTEALAKLEAGSVHKGVVRKVVAWGVFVAIPDAGHVEGLVHMTEASHDRGAKLEQIFKVGDEIEVKVVKIDEKGKLWLSRKALIADPWDSVKERYPVGSRHKGKVARLQPFGAFIELEPGVDGLIHTPDLTHKPIQHPQEVVKIGDEIEIMVMSSDPQNHKIGLHPAPPEGEDGGIRQRVMPHKTVKVAVVQAAEAGLTVRVLGVTGRASRGFIPAGHTATTRGTDLRKEFPVGTQLEAKVLEIDPRRGEVKLSIRALKEDAEKQAYQQYRAGVAREAKFGTFADLMKKQS